MTLLAVSIAIAQPGEKKPEVVKINDSIYEAIGPGGSNTFLIVTPGGNVVVEEAMDGVIASVKRGGTIAAPLAVAPIFPTMVTHMVGVGEETGALDAMLDKVADFYEDQVEASVKALTSILEPIMIIVIGGIVGFIVISMYLPLFEVYNHIE